MIIDAINCNNANVLHKGENRHSKKIEELDREQQILLIFKDKIITKGEMQINLMKLKIENVKKIELNPNNSSLLITNTSDCKNT